MKKPFRALCLMLAIALTVSFVACNNTGKLDETEWTADTIKVGNTAPTTGAYAAVGTPFNIALKAVIAEYNATKAAGAKAVSFVNRPDSFTADSGVEQTTKLVEDDKVFALVGHFGTPTVGATLNYIKEKSIPMVYAATGTDVLFNDNATGAERNILPVQPIFTTEGQVLLARAVAPRTGSGATATGGLGLKKIGVVFTNDDAGKGMKKQIEKQLSEIKKKAGYKDVTVEYQQIAFAATDADAAVQRLKDKGVQCVIIAANQAPATIVTKSMVTKALDVPALTSYVNASAGWVAGLDDGFFTANRVVYTNAWVDQFAADVVTAFAATILAYAEPEGGFQKDDDTATATYLPGNSFAMAGYIAGRLFIDTLKKTLANGGTLSRKAFVEAAEAAPWKVPMSPDSLDFKDGKRLGVTNLSFFAYVSKAGAFDVANKYYKFESIAQLMSALG